MISVIALLCAVGIAPLRRRAGVCRSCRTLGSSMRRSIRVLVICCAVLLACLPVFAEEQSKPDSWRGIPLMPGYHSEEEAGLGHLTVVNVPFERAERYTHQSLSRRAAGERSD
jgi:hypothetical protein